MENFIVSARKYRPSNFDTVVGQDAITSTLRSAIKQKHLAQAFLFCGPRGVGKTTCARILAKTINCFSPSSEGEACNECESCDAFNKGHSLNIFELDAASNNSVDDIRQLINQVRIAPSIGTKKVYIVDEVHMLSSAAFNAFLKTLEEPPSHAVFILATTEKHKILPTILSRCQIFNFSRISVSSMVAHLQHIALKEGVDAEEKGLHVIAEKADGGLRDALSIFDQLVSFEGGKITYEGVLKNLNVLDYDYYFKATASVIKRNVTELLLLFNEVVSHGFEELTFMNGWAEHLRSLLLSKDSASLSLIESSEELKALYQEQAKALDQLSLMIMLSEIADFDVQYKSSKNKRLLSEITLMRLCSDELHEFKKKSPVG